MGSRLIRLLVGFMSLAMAGAAMAAADNRAAEILSIQGRADFRLTESANWNNATVQQPLFGGNWVRTGDLSRIALLFVDETQVRLNQNTVLEVKEVNPPGKSGLSTLRLLLGKMWSRTKAIPANLGITTPSATAGIRGTDWEIEVEDNGRSTLAVYSGQVEFYNDQGRVNVGANEAAVAEIGKAPVKIVLTNFKDRVQWVTAYAVDPVRYIVLSSARMNELQRAAASAGDDAATRVIRGRALADLNNWTDAEREFLAASAAGDRSIETAVGLALVALRNGDRDGLLRYLEVGKKLAPDSELLHLAEAAAQVKMENFRAAQQILEGIIKSGSAKQPAAWLILADIKVYFGEAAEAVNILQDGLKRFPDDARLHAELARTYLFADRVADGRTEAAAALKSDPDSYLGRLAYGEVARIDGDGPAAEKSFAAAKRLNPADDRGFFGLGQVNSEREEVSAGRANLGQAIRINPNGPGYRGELGSLETFANFLDRAEAEFNAALKANPADYIALTGRGIQQLKRGEPLAALESFNKAGLMEPRYARVHVFSAVAYYQLMRPTRALESLQRASELDPKDPLPHLMASMIHNDYFEPAQALAEGRAALELLPNLKSLNQVANNQKGTANLGNALAFFGLEEWAQSYAQESYYPYWAGSHLFLSDRYVPGFNKNSELYQGFLTDPTVFGASNRFQELVQKPGNYQQLQLQGGSSKTSRFLDPELTLNGYSNNGTPFAYFVDVDDMHVFKGSNAQTLSAERTSGTVGLGIKPSYELGLFAFGDTAYQKGRAYNVDPLFGPVDTRLSDYRFDVGANYKFSPVSQLWLKVGRGNTDTTATDAFTGSALAGSRQRFNIGLDNTDYSLRHTMTLDSQTEITWGIEGASQGNPVDFKLLDPVDDTSYVYTHETTNDNSTNAYVSLRQPFGANLLLQGDLFYQHYRKHFNHQFGFSDAGGNETPVDSATVDQTLGSNHIAPRAGAVYRFAPNRLLRFAYQDWVKPASVATLAPVATAGIPVDDSLVEAGGRLKRTAAQSEWEYSNSTFIRMLIDRREVTNPRFLTAPVATPGIPDLVKLRSESLIYTPNNDTLEGQPVFGQGVANRVAFAVNQILTNNWSLLARYEYTNSHNTAAAFSGKVLPYLPKDLYSIGATWITPTRFYLTMMAVHRSERFTFEDDTGRLDPGWDAMVKGYWETPDKRFNASFVVSSLFKSQTSPFYGVGLTYRH